MSSCRPPSAAGGGADDTVRRGDAPRPTPLSLSNSFTCQASWQGSAEAHTPGSVAIPTTDSVCQYPSKTCAILAFKRVVAEEYVASDYRSRPAVT